MYCKSCSKKKDCTALCASLESHLSELEHDEHSDLTLSPDYIGRCIGRPDGSPDVAEIRYALKALTEFFGSFGYSSLKFFLMWRYHVEEGYPQHKIAEIFDVSQPYVSRVLQQIKERKFFFMNKKA